MCDVDSRDLARDVATRLEDDGTDESNPVALLHQPQHDELLVRVAQGLRTSAVVDEVVAEVDLFRLFLVFAPGA